MAPDGGASWLPHHSGTNNLLYSLSFSSGEGWAVGTYGTILHHSAGQGTSSREVWLPERILLQPNYPNPLNSATVLRFSIAKSSRVRLHIYDLLGRRVTTLANGFFPLQT